MESDYIPELYINSTFEPLFWTANLEWQIMEYTNQLERLVKHASKHRRPCYNLSSVQYKVLQCLKDDNTIIICLPNKNLGPAIMDRAEYIRRALDDHLLNTSVYTHLSVNDAHDAMDDVEKELTELFELYGNLLPEPEKIYLEHFFNLPYETVLHYNQSPQEQCHSPYCILLWLTSRRIL
jgi:hypothetical protein